MGVTTILVCDDNVLNRKLVTVFLGSSCYRVVEADCGQACLDYFEHQGGAVDLLLLDINMRDMSGFEVCDRLRQLDSSRLQHLPIIAYTAHAMEEEKQSYYAAGFDGVLLKPIEESALLDVIERNLVDVSLRQ